MICEGLLLVFFSIMIKQWLLLENMPISGLESKNHSLFTTKKAEINALFMTTMAEKPFPPHNDVLK